MVRTKTTEKMQEDRIKQSPSAVEFTKWMLNVEISGFLDVLKRSHGYHINISYHTFFLMKILVQCFKWIFYYIYIWENFLNALRTEVRRYSWSCSKDILLNTEIGIFHCYLIIPSEISTDAERHPEYSPCDGLNGSFHCNGRNLMNTLFDLESNIHMMQHVTCKENIT